MGFNVYCPLRSPPWPSKGGKAWKGGKMECVHLAMFSLFLHFCCQSSTLEMPPWTLHHPACCLHLSTPEPSVTSRLEWSFFIDPGKKVIELTWRERIWNAPFGHVTVSCLQLIHPDQVSICRISPSGTSISHNLSLGCSSSNISPPIKSNRKVSRFRQWIQVRMDGYSCTLLATSWLTCAGEAPLCSKAGPLAGRQAGSMLGKQQNSGAKLPLSSPLSSSLVASLLIELRFLFRVSSGAALRAALTN